MAAGQKLNGSTVNATIGVDSATGEYRYTFQDPAIDMQISLTNSSGIIVDTTLREMNDKFLLESSSGDTINAGGGNDTFVVANTSTSLNGDVLVGGPNSVNVVQVMGSGTTIDLTGVSAGTAASTGIEAVVAHTGLTGETVDVNLAHLQSSTLTDAGAGPGKAFVALIGADGQVNVTSGAAFQLVGVMNAAGQGFSAAGAALSGADTATLASMVTRIDDVRGTLATDYTGEADPTKQSYVPGALSAYVFSNGSAYYTVWTDGTVHQLTPAGATVVTAFQPGPSTPATDVLGTFSQFSKSDTWASGALGINPQGLTTLKLGDGNSLAYAAIQIKAGASGTVIRGDSGANGGDWFGLGGSGGGNYIYGTKAGDIFDLQLSTSLADILRGAGGFDVVVAKAIGTDVNLTANNPNTGIAATGIDAVVGSSGKTQTVEVNPNALAITLDSTGARTSVFEAMLGGDASDTVTLEGPGKWAQIATFAPGAPLPTHATPLADAPILDGLFGPSKETAENSLTGTLFESVGARGAALKYVTIYSDSAISNQLASASPALLVQAMAQMPSTSGTSSPTVVAPANTSAVTLAHT